MSTVTVSSEKGLRHQITAGKHTWVADAPKEVGGEEAGPNPHDLLLAALGACTGMTLQIFANKRGWDLKSVNVKLEEKHVDDPNNPGKQMLRIERHIDVTGDLTQEQIDSLKQIADKCPIHKAIVGPKEIATEIQGLVKA